MPAEKTIRSRRRRRHTAETADLAAENENLEEARSLAEAKGRATPGRRSQSGSLVSDNIVVRVFGGIAEYFDGVRSELQKVTWPTQAETRRLTLIVLGVTIVSALFLGIVSFLFTELFIVGLEQPAILFGVIGLAVLAVVAYLRFGSRQPPGY